MHEQARSTRRAAMERADQNISELLEELRSCFNQLRQSGIDEDLFDVLSGFEALAPAGGAETQNRSNGAR